jgi:hypothetical protein
MKSMHDLFGEMRAWRKRARRADRKLGPKHPVAQAERMEYKRALDRYHLEKEQRYRQKRFGNLLVVGELIEGCELVEGCEDPEICKFCGSEFSFWNPNTGEPFCEGPEHHSLYLSFPEEKPDGKGH